MTAVNIVSVKLTARVATLLSALKILALFVVALVGVVYIGRHGLTEQLSAPFVPYQGYIPSPSSIALALYGVTFAYDGWCVCVCECVICA